MKYFLVVMFCLTSVAFCGESKNEGRIKKLEKEEKELDAKYEKIKKNFEKITKDYRKKKQKIVLNKCAARLLEKCKKLNETIKYCIENNISYEEAVQNEEFKTIKYLNYSVRAIKSTLHDHKDRITDPELLKECEEAYVIFKSIQKMEGYQEFIKGIEEEQQVKSKILYYK